MDIIIDAMGGDNAPSEIVKGAAVASNKIDAKRRNKFCKIKISTRSGE